MIHGKTIHDIIQEIHQAVDEMASSLDLDRMPGGDISKEEFQEMVFVDSPSAIADILFDLADQIGIIQECVEEIETKNHQREALFIQDLDDNIPQTCDKCNKILSRKETNQ
jgi:hypothetical protein